MKIVAALSSIAIITFAALLPQSALALNQRSWVSNTGLDSNPCTLAAPCATFTTAIVKTNAGGTINCLNSGVYYYSDTTLPTSLEIDKSLTISCKGVVAAIEGGVRVGAGPTDRVVLEGLSIEPQTTRFDVNGLQVYSGGFVYLIDSTIKGYSGVGVFLQSPDPTSRLFIKNSTIQGNLSGGVFVRSYPQSVNIASIVDTLIDSNGPVAIQLTTSGSILGIQRSILNGSPAAISLSNGAQAYTVGGTNSVNGTFTFTGTIPLN